MSMTTNEIIVDDDSTPKFTPRHEGGDNTCDAQTISISSLVT